MVTATVLHTCHGLHFYLKLSRNGDAFLISTDTAKLLEASQTTGLSWLHVWPEAEVECLGAVSSDGASEQQILARRPHSPGK